MKTYIKFFRTMSAICFSIATIMAQSKPVFDSKRVVVVANKNKIGGKLVLKDESRCIDLYVFEKRAEYSISPSGDKIAITDTGGTASYSIYIIDSAFHKKSIDDLVYKKEPVLSEYSSVYPTIKRWISDRELLIHIEAYGPFDAKYPRKKRTTITVNITD